MFFDKKIDYHLIKTDFHGFPKMVKVEQLFNDSYIKDIESAVRGEIKKLNLQGLEDKRIAITAGSRGIPNYSQILCAVGKELKSLGAKPFIVPAMGSHGGATAEGQTEVLKNNGIDESSVGMPIYSSMDTVIVGKSADGVNVNCDKNAYEADAIVVCGRVKAHTDFRGPIESGLCKMMIVGLGKQQGAVSFHKGGQEDMGGKLINSAKVFIENTNILFGLAIIDSPYHKTYKVESVLPQNIIEREKELLKEANSIMPKILINQTDMLIVDELGKDISGAGLDPNITGRFIYPHDPDDPNYMTTRKIVTLRLTKPSHGNACGVGIVDFIPQKFAQEIDLPSTYTNCVSSRYTISGRIPMVMNNDLDTIYAAASGCGKANMKDVKFIRIKNTLELTNIWVSENFLPEIEGRKDLKVVSEPKEMEFDEEGNLKDLT